MVGNDAGQFGKAAVVQRMDGAEVLELMIGRPDQRALRPVLFQGEALGAAKSADHMFHWGFILKRGIDRQHAVTALHCRIERNMVAHFLAIRLEPDVLAL